MKHASAYIDEAQRKKRVSRRKWVFYSIISVGIVLVELVGYALFYTKLFQIKAVEISGVETIAPDEVRSFLLATTAKRNGWQKIIGLQNILFFPRQIQKEELLQFPKIKNISIKKNYGSRIIEVNVTERNPVGIWCFAKKSETDANRPTVSPTENRSDASVLDIPSSTVSSSTADNTANPAVQFSQQPVSSAQACWWFDEEAVIFEKALSVEGVLIMAITDYTNYPNLTNGSLPAGTATLAPSQFENLISIFKTLRQENMQVKEVALDDSALQEVRVVLDRGPTLFFSLRFPENSAGAIINRFLQKGQFWGSEYFDFRVENRVYYK
jgi:hypothetical protein